MDFWMNGQMGGLTRRLRDGCIVLAVGWLDGKLNDWLDGDSWMDG